MCISHFRNRTAKEKDPLLSSRRCIQRFPRINIIANQIQKRKIDQMLLERFLDSLIIVVRIQKY